MPLYEYECKKCGHRFEKIQLYSAKMVKKCPECGGQVEQMISAPAVQFKGSGWYVTDYAKKTSSQGSSGDSGSKEKKDEKSKSESSSKDTASKDTASKDTSAKDSSKSSSSKDSSSKDSSSKEGTRKGSGRHR
jgi:putative FmdB family regulatory protein